MGTIHGHTEERVLLRTGGVIIPFTQRKLQTNEVATIKPQRCHNPCTACAVLRIFAGLKCLVLKNVTRTLKDRPANTAEHLCATCTTCGTDAEFRSVAFLGSEQPLHASVVHHFVLFVSSLCPAALRLFAAACRQPPPTPGSTPGRRRHDPPHTAYRQQHSAAQPLSRVYGQLCCRQYFSCHQPTALVCLRI